MNIAVINIRDLIKYVIVLCLLIMIVVVGIKIVKGKGELDYEDTLGDIKDSSFLYCLEMEVPLMKDEDKEEKKEDKALEENFQILGVELEMLNHVGKSEKEESTSEETGNYVEEDPEEEQDRTVDIAANLETKVISENNIEASFTNSEDNVQVKNQSKYEINELLGDSNYELKNKDKVIIYHTHTCESYTSSEKYPYEMTGSYRTTDLQYTVARVRG